MAMYKITTTEGEDFGIFEGDSPNDALQALAASHGFFDWAEACSTGEFDDSMTLVALAD